MPCEIWLKCIVCVCVWGGGGEICKVASSNPSSPWNTCVVLQNNSMAFSGLVGLQARLTIKETKKEGGGEEASDEEGQDGSGGEDGSREE